MNSGGNPQRVLSALRRADATDYVALFVHSGHTRDGRGNLGTEKPAPSGSLVVNSRQLKLGDVSAALNDGSTPKGVVIIGCNSDQAAATIGKSTATTVIGVDGFVQSMQASSALVESIAALAGGATPEDAAAAGSGQFTHSSCPPGDKACDPTVLPTLEVVRP